MRIYPITKCNINFLSKSHDVYCDNLEKENNSRSFIQYEDAESLTREKLRAHIIGRYLTTYDSELNSIGKYANSIEDANILNLQKLAPRCYRGASLAKYQSCFQLLRLSGIETIIDLASSESLKISCEENGINYYPYNVDSRYWAHPIFKTDEDLLDEKKETLSKENLSSCEYQTKLENFKKEIRKERNDFVIKFSKLIDVINEGGFYICCEMGEYRTPNILSLNTFFNPQWKGRNIYPAESCFFRQIENMYHNLTAENKALLRFTESHEAFLKEQLVKIKNVLH